MTKLIACISFLLCVYVYGFNVASTIFKSYQEAAWLHEGAQYSLLSLASLRYHGPDTLHVAFVCLV